MHSGLYDIFGDPLDVEAVQAHFRSVLGLPFLKLLKHADLLRQTPDHPIHADVTEATHAHLSGVWRVARYDAPIEWYAARILNQPQAQIDFQRLRPTDQVAADTAMKRDQHPHLTEWADTSENLFLTAGIIALWQTAEGNTSAANTGASPAGAYASYNNLQARIGVGDSTTVANAAQTDLQASTNKYYLGMDATYPTQSTNQTIFRATFGSALALFAWNEFVVDNANGSNSTTTTRSGGSTLDRVVSAQGTKLSGQTFQPSLTLSIS